MSREQGDVCVCTDNNELSKACGDNVERGELEVKMAARGLVVLGVVYYCCARVPPASESDVFNSMHKEH